jgi:hypothetical protein
MCSARDDHRVFQRALVLQNAVEAGSDDYARFVPNQFPTSDSMMVSPMGTPQR